MTRFNVNWSKNIENLNNIMRNTLHNKAALLTLSKNSKFPEATKHFLQKGKKNSFICFVHNFKFSLEIVYILKKNYFSFRRLLVLPQTNLISTFSFNPKNS